MVVAYGIILPTAVLEAPPLRLPQPARLAAAALARCRPIHRAIMAGDAESGVMVMKMDERLDTSPIAMAERLRHHATHTAADVHDA